jgi:hypothetical protein
MEAIMTERAPTRQQRVAAVARMLSLSPGVTIHAWRAADFPAIQELSRAEE